MTGQSVLGALGEYTVTLNARADRVLDARWSLEGVDDKLYTKSTWGQAKAYAGYILPWLEELMEKTGAIRAAAQDPYFLSVEDAARFDGLYRAAGFPQERYNAGLPRAQDLNEQAAVNLALEALRTIYGLPADLKAHFDLIWPSYILRSGDRPFQSEEPVWIISFTAGMASMWWPWTPKPGKSCMSTMTRQPPATAEDCLDINI